MSQLKPGKLKTYKHERADHHDAIERDIEKTTIVKHIDERESNKIYCVDVEITLTYIKKTKTKITRYNLTRKFMNMVYCKKHESNFNERINQLLDIDEKKEKQELTIKIINKKHIGYAN